MRADTWTRSNRWKERPQQPLKERAPQPQKEREALAERHGYFDAR